MYVVFKVQRERGKQEKNQYMDFSPVFIIYNHTSPTIQQLVTCAVALALAYVTSYIKIFKLPFGGSVTLFSMLFIVLIGYWYGIKVGILTGLVYGIFSSSRSHMSFHFFRYAVITFWHLEPWGFPDYLQNPENMVFLKHTY